MGRSTQKPAAVGMIDLESADISLRTSEEIRRAAMLRK